MSGALNLNSCNFRCDFVPPSSEYFLLIGFGNLCKMFVQCLHLWNSLNYRRDDHVDENGVVSFTCCHGFGELGAESVVGDTLSLATSLRVLSNCFRLHKLWEDAEQRGMNIGTFPMNYNNCVACIHSLHNYNKKDV